MLVVEQQEIRSILVVVLNVEAGGVYFGLLEKEGYESWVCDLTGIVENGVSVVIYLLEPHDVVKLHIVIVSPLRILIIDLLVGWILSLRRNIR